MRANVTTLRRHIRIGPDTTVSSVWAIPDGRTRSAETVLILAHGAGNDMESPFLTYLHEAIASHGIATVKFNFPYKEQGRRAPDRAPVLEATWRAVAQRVREDSELKVQRLFLGGKSMGGRIASQVVARGEPCDGLIFLGYPLHPAGQPQRLRIAHLDSVKCPMLFVQGTRDPLCNLDLLKQTTQSLPSQIILHVVEQGDHSFKVPRRTGLSASEVWGEIAGVTVAWIKQTKLTDTSARSEPAARSGQ